MEIGIEVFYRDETLWLIQEAIALLSDKEHSTVAERICKTSSGTMS